MYISKNAKNATVMTHVEDCDVRTSLIQALVTVVDSSKAQSSVCLRFKLTV